MAAVGTTGTNTTNGNNTSQQLVDMNKVLHSLNTAHRNQLLLNQFIEVDNFWFLSIITGNFYF